MKDISMNHMSDTDPLVQLEILQNNDDTISLFIYHEFYEFPPQQIVFSKQGITDLIHDLNQVL
jgi:hypothetical protein